MRTTISIDDDLLQQASAATGIDKPSELVREALRALVQREAAQRLIRLGGSDPHAVAGPRRRPVLARKHTQGTK
ncbi:MAG: type II toxin-antitoxin system VapB family antitoxin [Rhodanobacteraceae bacterium]